METFDFNAPFDGEFRNGENMLAFCSKEAKEETDTNNYLCEVIADIVAKNGESFEGMVNTLMRVAAFVGNQPPTRRDMLFLISGLTYAKIMEEIRNHVEMKEKIEKLKNMILNARKEGTL